MRLSTPIVCRRSTANFSNWNVEWHCRWKYSLGRSGSVQSPDDRCRCGVSFVRTAPGAGQRVPPRVQPERDRQHPRRAALEEDEVEVGMALERTGADEPTCGLRRLQALLREREAAAGRDDGAPVAVVLDHGRVVDL